MSADAKFVLALMCLALLGLTGEMSFFFALLLIPFL